MAQTPKLLLYINLYRSLSLLCTSLLLHASNCLPSESRSPVSHECAHRNGCCSARRALPTYSTLCAPLVEVSPSLHPLLSTAQHRYTVKGSLMCPDISAPFLS
uniref:Putative secreted protein n=1 Tax=Amblyomma americanum TaxID=6943 RepID=A0A0C9R3W8_AMBAM